MLKLKPNFRLGRGLISLALIRFRFDKTIIKPLRIFVRGTSQAGSRKLANFISELCNCFNVKEKEEKKRESSLKQIRNRIENGTGNEIENGIDSNET